MKFKLKDKEVNTKWEEKFVFWKRTQDNWLVIFDKVWVKHDLTTNRQIYRKDK